jgi:hypothetical protein
VTTAKDPPRAQREVLAALELEARMLRTEALGPGERQAALAANARAQAILAALHPASPMSATSAQEASGP